MLALLFVLLAAPVAAQPIVSSGVLANAAINTILADTGAETSEDGALHEYAIQITCETLCLVALEHRNAANDGNVTYTVNSLNNEQRTNYIVQAGGVYTSPIKLRVFLELGQRIRMRLLRANTQSVAAVIFWE